MPVLFVGHGSPTNAIEENETMKRLILSGDHVAIVQYPDLGRAARLSVPTNEHFLPLLYALALQDKGEGIRVFFLLRG